MLMGDSNGPKSSGGWVGPSYKTTTSSHSLTAAGMPISPALARTELRTPMFKSLEMCGRCNGANVFVKREDKNPFGTFKDRRCAALLDVHSTKNELVFVHITTGNSGYSLGMMAREEERKTGRKIHVVNIVPKGLPSAIKKRLESCSTVHEMDLSKDIVTPDEMRAIARKLTGYSGPEENLISVESYGLANGYKNIIREIAEEGVKPKYIFVPVGEGELITELAREAESVWGAEAPKLVGVTISQNAIVKDEDFLKKPGKNIADKLVNGYSKFKDLVLNFVKTGRIELKSVSEADIAKEYKWLNSIGIAAEPSAAVAFCGAEKYDVKPEDTIVIINTGKGVYDQSAVEKRWVRRLVKGLKYAAAILATSAALTISALSAYSGFSAYQDKIYHSLYHEAELYANQDGDHRVSVEEAQAACASIPDRKSCDKVNDLQDISPRELEFYVRYQRMEASNDMVGREIMRKLDRDWKDGTFECEYFAASICNSREPTWQIFNSPFQELKHFVINNQFLYDNCKWLLKLP